MTIKVINKKCEYCNKNFTKIDSNIIEISICGDWSHSQCIKEYKQKFDNKTKQAKEKATT